MNKNINNNKKANRFTVFLLRTCAIFTPSIIAIYTAAALFNYKNGSMIPKLGTMYTVLAISAYISLSTLFPTFKRLGSFAAGAINFVCFGIIYYTVIIVLRGYVKDGMYTLVAMAVYAVLFIVYSVIRGVAASRKKKLILDNSEYNSMMD